MDVTYFPFDEQSCKVMFINWMYTSKLINFIIASNDSIDINEYVPASEWNLISTFTGANLVFDLLSSYPLVWFELKLTRVPTYFVANIILPAICLSILSCLAFLLPAESGEKMGLSVTVLMSYSVILLMISDNVPRAEKLPIFSELIQVFIIYI